MVYLLPKLPDAFITYECQFKARVTANQEATATAIILW